MVYRLDMLLRSNNLQYISVSVIFALICIYLQIIECHIYIPYSKYYLMRDLLLLEPDKLQVLCDTCQV